jgi:hypothetical protein
MSDPQLSKNTVLLSATDHNPPEDTPVAPAPSSGGGVFKKRAKTGSQQKRIRKPVVSIASAVSDDDLSDDSDNEQPRPDIIARRKRKRAGMISSSSSRKSTKEDVGVVYDVNQSGGSHLDPKNQATAISAEFTEAELLGRTKAAPVDGMVDNLYRGQNAYRTLIPKREQVTTKYNAMGPQKAASNIRMTTYTDYAPGMSLVIAQANA